MSFLKKKNMVNYKLLYKRTKLECDININLNKFYVYTYYTFTKVSKLHSHPVL
jgi:hypothetical protein